jgi:hypothetical protein
LNASGLYLNPSTAGCYINPIRNATQTNQIGYDTTTKEITYYTGSSSTQTLSEVLTAGNTATNSIALNNTGTGTNVISLLPNASANDPNITLTDGTTTNTIDKTKITLTDPSANTAVVKVVPYNSFASTGGQVQIGSFIDISNNAGRLAIAIGGSAGSLNQGIASIAIGSGAGLGGQGNNCIAIGTDAGVGTQAIGAIAIGNGSGGGNQGANSVCLGRQAGEGNTTAVGANAVAIGFRAGQSSQVANSICLNASGDALNPNQAGCFINPIRTTAPTGTLANYNTSTFELTNADEAIAIPTNRYNNMLSPYGYKWASWDNTTQASAVVSATNLVTNQTYVFNYWLPKGLVITNIGIWWLNSNTGTFTGSQIGIYSTSGVNPPLLASTAVVGASTPTGINSYPLTSPYTILTSGAYGIAINRGSAGVGSTSIYCVGNGNTLMNNGLTAAANRLDGYQIGSVGSVTLANPFAGTLAGYNYNLCLFIT